MTSIKRLLKEYKTIESLQDIILSPINSSNLYHWMAKINGPPSTPYENGWFTLDIKIPFSYPLEPPKVIFLTKIFHPNIHFKTGEICLDLLKTSWSAVYTLENVCRAIISLLSEPIADSPLNCDCGNLIRCGDLRGYQSLARMYTKIYAKE